MTIFGLPLSHWFPWRMKKQIIGWQTKLEKLLSSKKKETTPDLTKSLNRVIDDVVQQQQTKLDEYRRQQQHLEMIINTLTDAVIVTDAQTNILLANPAMYRLFNVSPECLGKPFLQSVRAPSLFEGITQTGETGQTTRVEFDYQGRFFAAQVTQFLASVIDGCLVVVSDVTEIKNAVQVRRDFTANVSHEMKTPLTAILGYSETLLQGALDDPAATRAFVEIIHTQSQRLKALIDDVLELARIESPAWKIEKQKVNVAAAIKEIVGEYQRRSKKMILEVRGSSTATIYSDDQALRHILRNLVDNAFKFTPDGGQISVTISEERVQGITVTVADTGIGIPPTELERIFERFYRVASQTNKEGTGLGLAIVKHLVEKLGGAITVTSAVGKGSSFQFSLPAIYSNLTFN